MRLIIAILYILAASSLAFAELKTVKITDSIYAFIGPLDQRSADNLGNNANFGAIITNNGVVLIDTGGSWNGAKQLHDAVKAVTNKPVTHVINTGGQDHRWIGNSYWKSIGAKTIASEAAVEDHQDRGSLQMTMLSNLLGEALDGTEPAYADDTFDRNLIMNFAGMRIEIYHNGQAHTPGDSIVWLPEEKVLFTGDIVYVERILGVGEMSNSASWVKVFNMMTELKPKVLVPGHGPVTTLARAKAETYDYLVNLRQKMAAYMETDGDMIGSVNVDQSAFKQLKNFDQLAKRNAQQVFSEMEFE